MTNPNKSLIERLEEHKESLGFPFSSVPSKSMPEEYLLIKEAIAALKAQSWTPIDKIPEEWKDGRKVDLTKTVNGNSPTRYPNCFWQNDSWVYLLPQSKYDYLEFENEYGVSKVTHAMLPPQAPKG